jgi:hypothetical protein
VSAYSHATHVVFLWAVPVALLGFVVALFLKQRPIRDTEQAGATDLGYGFGLPVGEDRAAILERGLARLLPGRTPAERADAVRAAKQKWQDAGYLAVADGRPRISADGRAIARNWVESTLAGWQVGDDPELAALLEGWVERLSQPQP